MFLCWNRFFFNYRFFQKPLSFCGAETRFPSREFWAVLRGGNSSQISKWSNLKIAHNSWLKAPRRLLTSFFDFKYFSYFRGWNHCFLAPFFWKNNLVSEGRIRLFRQKKSLLFPRGKSLLIFLNLKLKMLMQFLITFLESTYKLFVIILKNKENRRG